MENKTFKFYIMLALISSMPTFYGVFTFTDTDSDSNPIPVLGS